MQINCCLKCLNNIETYPCPHCGYDPKEGTANEAVLRPGTILHGRYLIGGPLGQGGFGITYRALDLNNQTRLAVKEYYPTGSVTRDIRSGALLNWGSTDRARHMKSVGMESFLKEAGKMVRVAHIPEVVRIRDAFRENNTAYIVMDYIRGETLKHYMDRKGGPLDWVETLNIFCPVIRAMEQVHQNGMVHRDLSPDNIMLQFDGKVRILDLGAAKDLKQNTGASSALVAKSGFSPVEQYTQRGNSGPWTDVYAMAATVYYVLTAIRPVDSLERLVGAEMDFDVPELKRIPQTAVDALKHGLAIRADDRIQSMGELLSELTRGITDAPQEKKQEKKQEKRREAEAGPLQVIRFGKYGQWGGKEDLEWLVLEERDDRVLLLSRYGLDTRKFNDGFAKTAWGWSSLRYWLNGTFFRTSFGWREKKRILGTDISGPDGSEPTRDQVFVLSAEELERYLPDPDKARCIPTANAISSGAQTGKAFFLEGKPTCMWWLRDRGMNDRTMCVNFSGDLFAHGMDAVSEGICVRPAMWISK